MKILVIGAGFVGVSTACVLAKNEHSVFIYDSNEMKLQAIQNRKLTFYEPGLEAILEEVTSDGKLTIYNWENRHFFDLTIICVGTPSQPDGSIDLTHVESAIQKCDFELDPNSIVAIKSTVIPGTTRMMQEKLSKSRIKLIAMPEFLREGSALKDALNPDRIIIGADSEEVAKQIAVGLKCDASKTILTSTFSAEAIKYISNSFLATCISFSNEVFTALNQDKDFRSFDVIKGWHSDKRFTNKEKESALTSYLVPGFGFGGSCFPKDVRALDQFISKNKSKSRILESVLSTNELITVDIATWIINNLRQNEAVILLGLGFKENTDDTRESPGIKLWDLLSEKIDKVYWYDKHVDLLEERYNSKKLTPDLLEENHVVVLCNHDDAYTKILVDNQKMKKNINCVFAIRYQEPISNIEWLHPREERIK